MKYKSLHDVCDFISGLWTGKKPPYIKVNVIRNTNFHKSGNLDFENVAELDVEIKQFNTRQLKFGDIILEKSGGGPNQPVGRVCLFEKKNEKFSLSNFTCALRVKNENELNYKYLYYFLRYLYMSGETEKIQKNSTGIRNLQIKLYKDYKLFIEPLPIQVKIVAKLDLIFAEIDKVIALTESKIKNLENFFNSYFLFLKTKNHSDWKKKTIGQLCNLMTGGTPSTKEKKYYQNGNIPWLVSGDINLDLINDCKGRITELGLKNSNAKFLPINSVMIALNGQGKTRGTVAILNMKATCNQSLVSIVPKDPNEIKSEIIYYILKSRYNEIRKLTGDSGNDRRGLNMQIIRKIELLYPSKLSEQNEIIKSSNLILLKLKKINEINLIKINELQLLKQSILKQAFNGELVKAA